MKRNDNTSPTTRRKKKGTKKSGNDTLGPIDLRAYEEEKKNAKRTGNFQKPFMVDIKDHHRFHIHWPLRTTEESGIYRTPIFHLCETAWSLAVSCGIFDDEEYLSLSLQNLSEEEVFASYSFKIFNPHNHKLNYHWSDPEGCISFSPRSDHNNEWGNPEFVPLEDLQSFLVGGAFSIEVEIVKRSHNSDLANQSLHEEIEKINDEGDLIKLANDDIVPLIKKLPVTRNLKEQSRQEDRIINSFK